MAVILWLTLISACLFPVGMGLVLLINKVAP
jgi:hypothetical protein